MQLILQGCAVVDFTFYCKIVNDYPSKEVKAGVYSFTNSKRISLKEFTLVQFSDKVWRQGPRGGVKIYKDRYSRLRNGYVTKNVEEMKKFMWAKLQAQPIK